MKNTVIKKTGILILCMLALTALLSVFALADPTGVTFTAIELSREKDSLKLDISVDAELVEKFFGLRPDSLNSRQFHSAFLKKEGLSY